MPFFDGVAGRVYYREWQAESPEVGVVFLHGFGEHCGVYHRLAAALNAEAITFWALDEIGHGLTDGERGRVERLDDLVANGQTLTDIAQRSGLPLVLAGHSLGGVTAALTAVRHGERYRGVVLSGTPLSAPPWMAPLLQGDDDGSQEFALDPDDLSADPFYLDALENDPLAFTEADVVGTLTRSLPPAWEELDGRLRDVRIPVLAVHGGEDPVAPVQDARAWVDALLDAEIAVFAGCRHDVLNDVAHRRVAEAISRFALRVARPGM